MNIELMAGPSDGTLVVVEDGTRIWVCVQPEMTPAQLVSLNEVLPSPEQIAYIPRLEHAYLATDTTNPRTGARLFRYAGVRQHR